MFPIQNVTVLGASGAVGTLLVDALLASNFTVSVVLRPSSSATFPASVTVHRANYDDLAALTSAFRGQDAIISAVGTFDAAIQRTAIDAAAAVPSVRRFIPSEYGGDTSQPGAVSFARFPQAKREIVQYLDSKEGLTWTAICTGSFINWLLELEKAAMGWDLSAHRVSIFDSGNRPFVVSTLGQVTRAIISVLRHEEETRNTYVYVKSFEVTQNQLLGLIERLSGTKFEVKHLTTEEIMQAGVDHLEKGDFEHGYPEVVTAVAYGPWGFLGFGDQAEKWNSVLGLPKEHLEETVREVLRKKKLLRE